MLAFQSTFEELLQSWQLRLQDAEALETDWPARLETCIRICEESLLELRQWVIQSSFPGKDCEIYFFKQVKPLVMARYIYYQKMYHLHIGYFNGSGLLKKERLERELHNIARYFTDNEDLYTYYRKGYTHHDELYFIRGQYDWRICAEVNHFDSIFSTSFDGKLAELMAYELLMKYVDGMLNPSGKFTEPAPVTASRPAADTLQCTASITDIVELGYALHANGFFNNGKASIKDIMHLLSATLKVNLGKFYDTSIQLRERKNPTQFLDELKVSVIRYFNQFDNGTL
jgi:RteC protein